MQESEQEGQGVHFRKDQQGPAVVVSEANTNTTLSEFAFSDQILSNQERFVGVDIEHLDGHSPLC
jgi:hypothetical protein